MPKPKIIVIVGPTASGKSALAVEIAKKFNGEIISADSRQVYKGLDIGSGKITVEEMQGIPHYLLDVQNPEEIFTVADFKILATKTIMEIISRDKLPIIVGGTGFYIDTILNNSTLPNVPPNPNLREELDQKTTSELSELLKKLDPDRWSQIDQKNKQRLIRAIEIAEVLTTVPKIIVTESLFNPLTIGMSILQEELDQKIQSRLIERLDAGMVEEVKHLHKAGLSYDRLESFGLEYKYIAYFLQDKTSLEATVSKLYTAIRQYSKRQMTWWKRNKNIIWVERKNLLKDVILLVDNFLKTESN